MTAPGQTVLWRLFHAARREHARAVMLPGGPPHTLALFVNDALDRVENYDTLDLAMYRSDDVRRTLEGDGWREET
ncbi:MAG: hypothetical protein AB1635_16060 [Acidobacteriota bacterium]